MGLPKPTIMAQAGLLRTSHHRAFSFAANTGVVASLEPTTPSSPVEQKLPDKPRHTRKAHKKVRTGCLTCKIRRKKCDETKPTCLRCTSTGRKCDGYPQPAVKTPVTIPPAGTADGIPTQHPPIDSRSCVKNTDQFKPRPRTIEVLEICSDSYPTESIANDDELNEFIITYDTNAISTTQAISPYAFTASSCVTSRATSPFSPSHLSKRRHLSPRARSPSITLMKAPLSRSPNFFPPDQPTTELECHCFSFFRHHTGPQFASYFDSSLWRTYSVQSALVHPVLFTVAAAVGAVHRRFTYGISREAFEYCGHAARLHAKAMRGLEELKHQNVNRGVFGTRSLGGGGGMGVYDRDVIMVAEMMLALFQGFQDNYSQAIAHTKTGLRYLLDRPMTLCHSESRHGAVESQPNTFRLLFNSIRCRALQLFSTPPKTLARWSEGTSLPDIPKSFASLDQARDYLFTETEWIMNTPAKVWRDPGQRKAAQHLHVSRLLRWSVVYADTVVRMHRTPREKKASILMKITRNMTYLLLYSTLFVDVDTELSKVPGMHEEIDADADQGSGLAFATKALWHAVAHREDVNMNLGRLKIIAEAILEENGIFTYDEHSISYDTAIGPPKKCGNLLESSRKTRHMVKAMMQEDKGGDDEIREVLGVYGIAERVSAIEEHAVIDSIRSIIPQHIDPKWVDVTCIMETRKILLRYCRPSECGLGITWTQEWWAF